MTGRYVFHWNASKCPDPPALAAAFRDAGVMLAANIKPCLLVDHPRYAEAAERGLFISDSAAPHGASVPETSVRARAEADGRRRLPKARLPSMAPNRVPSAHSPCTLHLPRPVACDATHHPAVEWPRRSPPE